MMSMMLVDADPMDAATQNKKSQRRASCDDDSIRSSLWCRAKRRVILAKRGLAGTFRSVENPSPTSSVAIEMIYLFNRDGHSSNQSAANFAVYSDFEVLFFSSRYVSLGEMEKLLTKIAGEPNGLPRWAHPHQRTKKGQQPSTPSV
jgi:hypothetical protein